MEERIRGSFPGGPRRGAPAEVRTKAPRLRRVREIEAAVAKRGFDHMRRRRRRRVLVGFVFALTTAGGVGAAIGLRSHTTSEELVTAGARREAAEMDISKDLNRTLLELWKMEDVEFMRNSGRR